MERAGVVSVSLLLYLIFIASGTSLCLSALAFAGHFVIWRGLDFPVNFQTAVHLLEVAGGGIVFGWLFYQIARRLF
jgi:hypothetical protein